MPRPRQSDIAKLAGVSQATVSVVLGGNRSGLRMAERTRLRVLAAAEQLGYVPDPVATRLASRHNSLLGVYTFKRTFPTNVADSYYPILVGVEEEAAALGQDLVLFTGARDHDAAELRRTRIADGCLFFGRHVPADAVAPLVADGFPLVYIGRRDEPGIPYVGADYVTASAAVVRRLVGLGHREIRYLREPDEAPSSADRERGVLDAAREAGLDVGVVRTDGPAPVRRWVEQGVTAVVVEETDTSAAYLSVRRAVEQAGLSVPHDLSLAVLGQPPDEDPAVTGFQVPRYEMGRAAVRLLVDLVTGVVTPDSPQAHRLLPCTPVPGRSVGAPNTANRQGT
ncbi:LacI family DNA-binding transcriptional regulator [Saccharothrix longispora]|uniref:DNA-binding LacI/PurR family transcriptional regulator n=1 Tax=Saccharothrix longispora TaxID=33920 RepID=A0ABU1PST5_9PSEU|nr:LacI family DNA-binding transcriptional regulator [Saccharothrix longispora]MDR6593718.1 DNA-binding LacI/PurR family transcriptional regulator [Saccharothrix longispora]